MKRISLLHWAAAMLAAPLLLLLSCSGKPAAQAVAAPENKAAQPAAITPGAERPDLWLPLLEGRRVALLSNHTGTVRSGDTLRHTLDAMLDSGVDVRLLFSPEHGFRGKAEAGAHVAGGTDALTGLPVVSLYNGAKSKPGAATMDKFDVLVVDLQDVGARFYTYHITMLEMMEAAARAGKQVVVLDRPNPLGMVVDGPMLDPSLRSGVGRLPVPAIHGLTMGEIALMANGEGWLADGLKAQLEVVPVDNYTHSMRYSLPVAPSPNLKDDIAILLYPSLCLFEGTPVSVGRGTDHPFTLYGSPAIPSDAAHPFSFTPRANAGAKNPPFKGELCHGVNLIGADPDSVIARGMDLGYVIDAYRASGSTGDAFFKRMFDLLAGDPQLKRQIAGGMDARQIKATWQPALDRYRTLRANYLLYEE